MKKYIVFFFSFFLFLHADAQKDIRTDTLKVSGNCNMCKERIEEAAYIKGVKHAEWKKAQQLLVVTYRPSRTHADSILKHISRAGHRSEKFEADSQQYEKLPNCCQYKADNRPH